MNGCCNDCGITFGKTECLHENYEATSMPVFTIFAPAAAAKRGDKGDRNHFRQQNGTLAQLVQSIALTGQGSLVRVQYVPHKFSTWPLYPTCTQSETDRKSTR